jgi:fluoroacetyl-CoA thioesterase
VALRPGLAAAVEAEVGPADTAEALGSGDVPVLGTPRVLALLEAASVRALADGLPAGQTTVGIRVELDHVAASPVGRRVTAHARLASVVGRTLRFEVSLHDGDETVARGMLERALVDRQQFLAAAQTPVVDRG